MWCTARVQPVPPIPPEAPEKATLPLWPMLLPMTASVVFAFVTQSALALLLGAIGPVASLVTWAHSQRRERHRYEEKKLEFESAQRAYLHAHDALRTAERERARRNLPSVQQWVDDPLWRHSPDGLDLVRIGESWWEPPPGHPLADTGGIAAMPAAVPTAHGVALVAPEGSWDLWRSLALQWCLSGGADGLSQARSFVGGSFSRNMYGTSRATWVQHIRDVPDECRIILRCTEEPLATVIQPGQDPRIVRLDRVSGPLAERALEKLSRHIPQEKIAAPDGEARERFLGRFSDSSAWIDLVEQGPHCVVWGATGSGKSVSVCSLVHSLAESYPPHRLAIALVDFKGGAGLRSLVELPHTVGVVTDLEAARSDRARGGIAAEMIHRETVMATRGVAEWADLPEEVELPRLLIVIDEVAWLCSLSPEWMDTISDVARRGRSLGVHLVLSTQRVSGVLPRDVMANVLLRVCGRVSDESEVMEWMPDLLPAQRQALRHAPHGRVLVQGATAAPQWHDVFRRDYTAHQGVLASSARRVWSEELPEQVAPREGVWGLWDHMQHRTHESLEEMPISEGILAIVGDPRMGKTNLAHALGQLEKSVLSPRDPAGVWACLDSVRGQRTVVIVDDSDHMLQSAGSEGETFLLDALQEYPGLIMMTLGPRHRLSRSLTRLATMTLVLGIADAEDRARWGGPAKLHPGRLRFLDNEVQAVFPAPPPDRWEPPIVTVPCAPLVFTASPDAWGSVETVFCGPPHLLASSHLDVVTAVHHIPVILDGVSHRDVRTASFGALNPPPLLPAEGECWFWLERRWVLARTADLQRAQN